jgi:hypothetical protein
MGSSQWGPTVKLPFCRRVLGQASLPPPAINAASDVAMPMSPRMPRSDVCPACHRGQMQVQGTWFPQCTALDGSWRMLLFDTSQWRGGRSPRSLYSEGFDRLTVEVRLAGSGTGPQEGTRPSMHGSSRMLARHTAPCRPVLGGLCSQDIAPQPP